MLELIGIIENFFALRVETLRHLLFRYPEVEILGPKAGVLSLEAGIFKALYSYKLEFHLNKCVFKKTLHTMEKTSDAG